MQTTIIDRIRNYYGLVDETHNSKGGAPFEFDKTAVAKIAELFADNGVYEREGWDKPFVGKIELTGFFGKDRPLTGEHSIKSVESIDGVANRIMDRFTQKFSDTDISQCHTIKVTGQFLGAKVSKDNEAKATHAEGPVRLQFEDYWVVSGEKVLYRFSKIQRENKAERY